jgi:hypothetical protein
MQIRMRASGAAVKAPAVERITRARCSGLAGGFAGL